MSPRPQDTLALCALRVERQLFGIDTREVREVLGHTRPRRVPLAPSMVAGVVPYRGDVLTTLSLRALLGLPPSEQAGSVVIFEPKELDEPFGLAVDRVEGVVTVNSGDFEQNPSTLDARSMALFEGTYRTARGLLVRLSRSRIAPARVEALVTGKGANEQ